MTILILGGLDDTHACHMLDHLRGRGARVELLDSRWFPADLRIAYDPERDNGWFGLPTGRRVEFAEVSAVYWRCYNHVAPPILVDPDEATIADNDSRGMFESTLIRLRARWVNSWKAYRLHQTKPVQLALVASLGIPIPPTVLGNDPEAVLDFAARNPRCIFKPVQGGSHTQYLTPAHLETQNLVNLAKAPVTIQAEVVGTNIRVFVAGQRVLACEILTESLDFRDDPEPLILPHTLPEEISYACVRAARVLDLLWTGIDLRLTPKGEYIFLEANPSPMFIGFESRSGLPLTNALGDLLLNRGN